MRDGLVVHCLRNPTAKTEDFLRALVSSRCLLGDAQKEFMELAQDGPQQVRLSCALPFGAETLTQLEQLDENVQEIYWRQVNVPALKASKDSNIIVEKLLGAGRPHAAMAAASFTIESGETPIATELLEEVLVRAAAAHPEDEPSFWDIGVSHNAEQILAVMDARGVQAAQMAMLEFRWIFALSHHTYSLRHLHSELARNPDIFVSAMEGLYRGHTGSEAPPPGPDQPSDERRRAVASAVHELLRSWKSLPGRDLKDGSLDCKALGDWVEAAREKCLSAGRIEVGDIHIGTIFASSPMGADGIWPHECVRRLIESLRSEQVDGGFMSGIFNARGVFHKGLEEGGQQERDLAATYRSFADKLAADTPRTSTLLRRVADNYLRDARREDGRANLRG